MGRVFPCGTRRGRVDRRLSVGGHSARARIMLALLVGLASGCLSVRGNLRAVEADALYRSGQLSAPALDRVIERRGIRTVINLRGPTPAESWYREERDRCDAQGVAHCDFDWSI